MPTIRMVCVMMAIIAFIGIGGTDFATHSYRNGSVAFLLAIVNLLYFI